MKKTRKRYSAEFKARVALEAIRWALGARDFDLRAEGLRLFDAQCRLLAAEGE